MIEYVNAKLDYQAELLGEELPELPQLKERMRVEYLEVQWQFKMPSERLSEKPCAKA